MSEQEKKTVVEEQVDGDMLKIVEVTGKKKGAPIDIANFMENEHVKAILEAENIETVYLYIQDKDQTKIPPAVVMCSGNIENIGQCLMPLVRSCIEHDPAKLLILNSILMDVIIKVLDQHFKTIHFPCPIDNPLDALKTDCIKSHNIIRDILGKMGYMEFVNTWVRIMIETANEQDPEIRDKVLATINNTFSYSLYKSMFESNEKGN